MKLWKQLMMRRLQYTQQQIQQGISLLVTDIDNVFVRYLPLSQLWHEPYHVMHAYATAYPTPVFQKLGFVVCSGHQWLKASNETAAFLDIVLQVCRSDEKCDDQVAYNMALAGPARIEWHDNDKATAHARFANQFLMHQRTGHCAATNHSVKIWSRDFAFRSHLEPSASVPCPSAENWVAMPVTGSLHTTSTGMPRGVTAKVATKMATMDAWLQLCGPNGTVPKRLANATTGW